MISVVKLRKVIGQWTRKSAPILTKNPILIIMAVDNLSFYGRGGEIREESGCLRT